MNSLPAYVLDSFAVLAFFQAEPGGPRVRSLFESASQGEKQLLMTVVNLGEVVYRTFKGFGSDRSDEVLGIISSQFNIEFVDVDKDLALQGAQIKARYTMSYADCIAAALAIRRAATVITGDPEFKSVEGIVRIEWLPQPNRG